MAQTVKLPTLAQVMISQVMGLSPTSGSALTAQTLDSVSPSLWGISSPLILCLSVSLSKMNKH